MTETLTFPSHLLTASAETYEPMELNENPRVLRVQFGDGYSQRLPDGLNSNLQRWSLTYTKKPGNDVASVYNFLRARGGAEAFFWTPRGESSPRKFICSSYKRTFDAMSVVQSISFDLEEVPDL